MAVAAPLFTFSLTENVFGVKRKFFELVFGKIATTICCGFSYQNAKTAAPPQRRNPSAGRSRQDTRRRRSGATPRGGRGTRPPERHEAVGRGSERPPRRRQRRGHGARGGPATQRAPERAPGRRRRRRRRACPWRARRRREPGQRGAERSRRAGPSAARRHRRRDRNKSDPAAQARRGRRRNARRRPPGRRAAGAPVCAPGRRASEAYRLSV